MAMKYIYTTQTWRNVCQTDLLFYENVNMWSAEPQIAWRIAQWTVLNMKNTQMRYSWHARFLLITNPFNIRIYYSSNKFGQASVEVLY